MSAATCWNSSVLATKSVSQLSSSSTPAVLPSRAAVTRPLAAVRSARLLTSFAPLTRRSSTARLVIRSLHERVPAVEHAGARLLTEPLYIRRGVVHVLISIQSHGLVWAAASPAGHRAGLPGQAGSDAGSSGAPSAGRGLGRRRSRPRRAAGARSRGRPPQARPRVRRRGLRGAALRSAARSRGRGTAAGGRSRRREPPRPAASAGAASAVAGSRGAPPRARALRGRGAAAAARQPPLARPPRRGGRGALPQLPARPGLPLVSPTVSSAPSAARPSSSARSHSASGSSAPSTPSAGGARLLLAVGRRSGPGDQAIGDSIGHHPGQQGNAADRVVIPRDRVGHLVGVAVGVEDRDRPGCPACGPR